VNAKPVIRRKRAGRDIEDAIDYYADAGGGKAARGFVDALHDAIRHIARHPASGSPRYAHELNLADLRGWALKRYPYVVFYIEREDHVDVWRVLHAQRDIPASMREDP
jgi:toxin ParE1/3/4